MIIILTSPVSGRYIVLAIVTNEKMTRQQKINDLETWRPLIKSGIQFEILHMLSAVSPRIFELGDESSAGG